MVDSGGPAFPIMPNGETPVWDGMSLRDYFATAALMGDLAASANARERPDPHDLSRYAYSVADAMMKTRETE